MKILLSGVTLTVLLFCSCRARLTVNYDDAPPPERAFLESLLASPGFLSPLGLRLAPEAGEGTGIQLSFFTTWEPGMDPGAVSISRTCLVPRADALEGRRDTTRESCLSGAEDLIPLAGLEPPHIALRVEGRTAGDPDYPLVRVIQVRIAAAGDGKPRGGIQKKIDALEKALREAPKPLMEDPPDILWIASAGDLMLDRGAQDILFNEGPAGIFGGTAEFLRNADLALVNLEGPVSGRGTREQKSYNFRFDPETAAALRDAGIDAVLQANNHAFDYGETAFLDSLNHLETAGIGVLGAGLDEDTAAGPFKVQRGARKAAVFGIASFPRERNGWDGLTAAAGEDRAGILHAGRGGGEKLKSRFSGDDTLDIVLFHGGVEWSRRPDGPTRAFYTDLIEHGADLIIGSHPHIVQGFEWVRGRAIFWSLGNYVFGGMENTDGGEEGLFLRLGFLGTRLVYLEPYPLTLSHTRTGIAPAEQLDRFYALSRELRDHGRGNTDK
ncbi:MAG: CapA family protein [Spirochaetaceae bacterium]|jgi:poly-gamma-glutamate synthesis protein (capsule biosynthesis protein)|nr:CapA family protein [Spirochaetaceae bacterium]